MTTKIIKIGCVSILLLMAACRQDMHDQPRYKPLAGSTFFDDGRSARPPVGDTVARGQLRDDELLYTGKVSGQPVDEFPFPVDRSVLDRGRERFNIYCSVCHGQDGNGGGMIVQRGFKKPPSLHEERLRSAPAGYLFGVITNGIGTMYSYASRVRPDDRWAIVAYIRALQLSRHATIDDVPRDQHQSLLDSTQ